VLVTSAAHQDGKTTVATNLALACAQDDRDVVLIDADLRRPQVATRLGCDVNFGLDAVLLGEHGLDEALIDVENAGGGRLRVLPAGSPPPNPSVLLGSDRMRALLAELTEKTDMIVLDTPALLAVSDAIPLMGQVAGTVLVARMNRTTRDSLERSRQVITSSGGSILGVVATGTRAGGLYGYGEYGYGYYESSSDDEVFAQNGAGNGGQSTNGPLQRIRQRLPGGSRSSDD
jgi:polysaccharide biosynthesis transport protein